MNFLCSAVNSVISHTMDFAVEGRSGNGDSKGGGGGGGGGGGRGGGSGVGGGFR